MMYIIALRLVTLLIGLYLVIREYKHIVVSDWQIFCHALEKANVIAERSRCMKKEEELKRKYISYKEGAVMYGVSERKFFDLARDANAVYKVGTRSLVKIELIDQYMESFHVDSSLL